MTRFFRRSASIFAMVLTVSLMLSACVRGDNSGKSAPDSSPETTQSYIPSPTPEETATPEASGTPDTQPVQTPSPAPEIDLEKIRPNENGKIMIVMFHNFIEEYKSGDKEYTTTFDAFRELLQTLYDMNYRLISLNDFINNNIDVPAGCIPMIFSFDDGTPGQFNLVEEDGKLVANRQSAVGIMEEFNQKHPDFGMKGIFYVNLGNQTFKGKGTLEERLKYLIDKGFEIGNHTYTHIMLNKAKSADEIQEEIGKNVIKMNELVPGYIMNSLSLPYGLPSRELQSYVAKGEYEGMPYENLTIMKVGANPTFTPVSNKFNPLAVPRVRASGIEPVDGDLAWWLSRLSRDEQYISDGNPDTITIPEDQLAGVDPERLKGKQLITY